MAEEAIVDSLKEILNIGLGKGSSAFCNLLETNVVFSIPETTIVNDGLKQTFNTNLHDQFSTTVYLHFDGLFEGTVALALTDASIMKLVQLLTGEDPSSAEFDEIASDTLSEVGNILLNNSMGAISNIFKKELKYEVPQYHKEKVCDVLKLKEKEEGDSTYFITVSKFESSEVEVYGEIVFVFELKTFDKLLQSVDITDLTRHLYGYRVMKEKALEEVSIRKVTEQKLKKLNEDLQVFNARVAHDLKSPLAFLKSMADFLLSSCEDPQAIKKYAEMMQQNADKGLAIVEGIYKLSNLNEDELRFDVINLNDLISDVKHLIQHDFEKSGAEIEIDCPIEVLGSKEILPQVFQNLMSNSIKFSKGVSHPKIKVTSRLHDNIIQIKFEDNGPGIPLNQQERLFKAFERNHGSEVEGLGLGLDMVKKIVELHDGTIKIEESKELGGACFLIEFFHRKEQRFKIEDEREIEIFNTKDPDQPIILRIHNRSHFGMGGTISGSVSIHSDDIFRLDDRGIPKIAKVCWWRMSKNGAEQLVGLSVKEITD